VPTVDRLADAIWPDYTIRMQRLRFLTAIAVMSMVCEPFRDKFASDEVSPANQVFEWYVVEAHARMAKTLGSDIRGLPGSEKARSSLAAGLPLSADRYLKTPSVFGFHGIYKRLARGVGIVDEDLYLGEEGYRLLMAWEQDQGFEGFADHARKTGPGPDARARWQDAVRQGLGSASTTRGGGWQGWRELAESLRLDGISQRERKALRAILAQEGRGHQAEFLGLLDRVEIRDSWQGPERERAFLTDLSSRCSAGLRESLRAILEYEVVTRHLDDAWRLLLFLSTQLSPTPLTPRAFADKLPSAREPRVLVEKIDRAANAIIEAHAQLQFDELTRPFLGVTTGTDIFHALLERHEQVQRRKPPHGKRPWIERSASDAVVVRVPYRVYEPPSYEDEFVDPYRTVACIHLLDDLHGRREA